MIAFFPFIAKAAEEAANSAIGLPSSTQWMSEQMNSLLYIDYNAGMLRGSVNSITHYNADFGSARYAYPSMDFFSHLFSLAGQESASFLKNFSVWGRYSLGLAVLQGKLSDTQTQINTSLEKSSLLILSSRFGILFSFDRWGWIKPYFGIEISPYFFRQTADISGAEQQGEDYYFSPVAGMHLPLFFNGRGTILTEVRKNTINNPSSKSQLFRNSNTFTAGLGVTF